MKIYLDLLLIQNTLVTSLIIYLTGKLLDIKLKIVRILTISFLSSIFLIFTLMYFPNLYNTVILKMFISLILVKYGIGVKVKDKIIPKIAILWFITILFGGIGVLVNGNIIQMIILIVITIIFTLKFNTRKKDKLLLEAATCFIEFEYKETKYKLKSLVDTGHNVKTLYDEDVIFVKDNILNQKGGDKKSRRIVSYQTISGTNTSEGVKIRNINISYGKKNIKNNAVIVSTPNIPDCFDAIVSVNLIEGGVIDGNINFNETKSQEIIS